MPRLSHLRCALFLALAFATQPAQAQWQILPTPTTADLRGIQSLPNGVAWASGTEGTVLRTTDDGKTWQRCATPPGAEHLDFRGIQAFDAQTAIVMSSGKGDLSRLYKTTDACQTWKLVIRTNPDKDGLLGRAQCSKIQGHMGQSMLIWRSHSQRCTIRSHQSLPRSDAGSLLLVRRRAITPSPPYAGTAKTPDSGPGQQSIFAASNSALLSFQDQDRTSCFK